MSVIVCLFTALSLLFGGGDVTAGIVVRQCEDWRYIVDRFTEEYDLDADLVLAVMAKESNCENLKSSQDGLSVGLMQIVPRSWTMTKAYLENPVWNIWQGMRFMSVIYSSEQNDGTWRTALAAYNCGWTSLNDGKCHAGGGYAYADRILGYWFPLMRASRMGAVERLWFMWGRHGYTPYRFTQYAAQQQGRPQTGR